MTTANYIQNIVYTRSTNCTPHELWYGTKPTVENVHIFGSKCFVHTPTQRRQKLDNKACEMIYLGVDSKSKAYRCYNPYTNRVVVSRDVLILDLVDDHKDVSIDYETNRKFKQPLLIEEERLKVTSNVPINNVNNICNTNQETSTQENEQLEEIQDANSEQLNKENDKRTSSRINKGVPARKYIDEIWSVQEIKEPKTFEEAISCEEKVQWLTAMQEEIASMESNGTWELTELPKGKLAIGNKWVYKLKRNTEGDMYRFKARLVAQGFSQKYGVDYDEVFAPVVNHTTFRIFLSIAGKYKMIVNHLDVKAAFLNGKISETIFMKQPQGFISDNPDLVCLLKKSLYGLKQAARQWNNALHEALINLNFVQSLNDPCLYCRNTNDSICYIIVHVDDILIAGVTQKQIDEIENKLSKLFQIKNLGQIKNYLGIEATKDEHGNFQICQSNYIKQTVREFGLLDAKPVKTPMDLCYGKGGDSKILENNTKYRKLIGHLLYISVNTRPDISAAVSILAQKVSQPTTEDWSQCKRILKYLNSTVEYKLRLSNGIKTQNLSAYADANWAEERSDRKSNSGRVIFYNGGTIGWTCQKQSFVATSTCEAEYISLSEAAKEIKWIRQLLGDMLQSVNKPTEIYNDNQSCLRILNEEKFSFKTKHMDTRYKMTKDLVKKNIIQCIYCPTNEMIADLLTKSLPPIKHNYFCEECNLK